MDLIATLDMDDVGLFHGRVKSLGKAMTRVTLSQRPPSGVGCHLSLQRSASSPVMESVTAKCIIGSVVALKDSYDVGLLIEDWDDDAMRILFLQPEDMPRAVGSSFVQHRS